MAVLPIRITQDPVLHSPASPVTEFDESLRTLVADMFETMDAAPGVGLAGPQVGVPLRLFVYSYLDDNDVRHRGVAINPTLMISPPPIDAPTEDDEEGCLSFPGERFPLVRSTHATLHAFDLEGQPYTINAEGWYARIFQHEFDHLNGILYVDRLELPFAKAAERIRKKRGWNGPGSRWLPGVDNLEGP